MASHEPDDTPLLHEGTSESEYGHCVRISASSQRQQVQHWCFRLIGVELTDLCTMRLLHVTVTVMPYSTKLQCT
eukprot:scaffold86717_cov49-Prasinocladus_malaysianus.AAC.3